MPPTCCPPSGSDLVISFVGAGQAVSHLCLKAGVQPVARCSHLSAWASRLAHLPGRPLWFLRWSKVNQPQRQHRTGFLIWKEQEQGTCQHLAWVGFLCIASLIRTPPDWPQVEQDVTGLKLGRLFLGFKPHFHFLSLGKMIYFPGKPNYSC